MLTDFNYLYRHLTKIENLQLLGKHSHQKMWSPERKELIESINLEEVNPKESAVMAILFPIQNKTHLLFIERAVYEGVHSGQIAFPGGKREPDDIDLYQTALRETEEEVGILPSQLQDIKALSPVYVPPSNFLIMPFLAIHTQPMQVRLDEVEVKSDLSISLADLLNPENLRQVRMNTSYGFHINVPAYVVNEKIIWGATAMIVAEILDLLHQI